MSAHRKSPTGKFERAHSRHFEILCWLRTRLPLSLRKPENNSLLGKKTDQRNNKP